MRNGSDANTVPASVRCRPSTRMSFSVNGSTAHAEPPVKAAARARDKTVGRNELKRGEKRMRGNWSVQAQKAGHVVVESERHHQEHDGHAASLQPLKPSLRDRPPCHCFEKIIHQVSAIEHRQ